MKVAIKDNRVSLEELKYEHKNWHNCLNKHKYEIEVLKKLIDQKKVSEVTRESVARSLGSVILKINQLINQIAAKEGIFEQYPLSYQMSQDDMLYLDHLEILEKINNLQEEFIVIKQSTLHIA